VAPGCRVVSGNALDYRTYAAHVSPADTFVHLVGVSHPSPSKAELAAATAARVGHFVYVSVTQPAPVMRAYVAARAEAAELIRASGLNATILRPWYVLGPGHWWPVVLLPLYGLASLVPATRESARRLGLVTLGQMVRALVAAVADPAHGTRVVEVPQI